MKKTHELSENVFKLDGKVPLKQAIPLGLQHVMAMFVGNLTPLLIITGTCGIAGGDGEWTGIGQPSFDRYRGFLWDDLCHHDWDCVGAVLFRDGL